MRICSKLFSTFSADTTDDDVFLFVIYFTGTRTDSSSTEITMRWIAQNYWIETKSERIFVAKCVECFIFPLLSCKQVNNWITVLLSLECLSTQSVARKKCFIFFAARRMHRICFEPSHVNEMKRNDRTNVKSIRYITRSYTNWNENISQQDTQRGTKTKSSIQADSDSQQLLCVTGNERIALALILGFPFLCTFPLCLSLRRVASNGIALSLSFAVCRKHSLRISVSLCFAFDCYWNHWCALTRSDLHISAFYSIIVQAMGTHCCSLRVWKWEYECEERKTE